MPPLVGAAAPAAAPAGPFIPALVLTRGHPTLPLLPRSGDLNKGQKTLWVTLPGAFTPT